MSGRFWAPTATRCRMNPLKLGPIATMLLIAVCVCQGQSTQAGPPARESGPAPLLLEKNEGERRIWRDPPLGGFMLKISPKNNRSRHLVMGMEDLLPGSVIPEAQTSRSGRDCPGSVRSHACSGRRSGARPASGRHSVHSGIYLGEFEEQREPASDHGVHILGARVRESPAMCIGAGE